MNQRTLKIKLTNSDIMESLKRVRIFQKTYSEVRDERVIEVLNGELTTTSNSEAKEIGENFSFYKMIEMINNDEAKKWIAFTDNMTDIDLVDHYLLLIDMPEWSHLQKHIKNYKMVLSCQKLIHVGRAIQNALFSH